MNDPKARLLLYRTGLSELVGNALFSERRASVGDRLPGGEVAGVQVPGPDRRGWWADSTFGSRVWELMGGKLTPDLPERGRMYAAEALAPLVTQGILGSVEVACDFLTRDGGQKVGLSLSVTCNRPGGPVETLYYDQLWGAL